MRGRILAVGFAMLAVFSWAMASARSASQQFELLTGKAFSWAVPRDFYLEGKAIPTQKRNAVLLQTPDGHRVLAALIDTTGYSSQIQQKYIGMLISEGGVAVCGTNVPVGSYGFGLKRPAPASNAEAEFSLYNQAGARVVSCKAENDLKLLHPRPLQVVLEPARAARLYLGRYWLELRAESGGEHR